MIYSITFDLKSNPTTPPSETSVVLWARSGDEPTIDKVQKLIERLYGDDANQKSIRISVEGDEKGIKKRARLYDLDQE